MITLHVREKLRRRGKGDKGDRGPFAPLVGDRRGVGIMWLSDLIE